MGNKDPNMIQNILEIIDYVYKGKPKDKYSIAALRKEAIKISSVKYGINETSVRDWITRKKVRNKLSSIDDFDELLEDWILHNGNRLIIWLKELFNQDYQIEKYFNSIDQSANHFDITYYVQLLIEKGKKCGGYITYRDIKDALSNTQYEVSLEAYNSICKCLTAEGIKIVEQLSDFGVNIDDCALQELGFADSADLIEKANHEPPGLINQALQNVELFIKEYPEDKPSLEWLLRELSRISELANNVLKQQALRENHNKKVHDSIKSFCEAKLLIGVSAEGTVEAALPVARAMLPDYNDDNLRSIIRSVVSDILRTGISGSRIRKKEKNQ